jgi:predicted GIY-YIG superfamily endonuclease
VESAINREKQLKNWHRDWKINLINQFNPKWKDQKRRVYEMPKQACPEEMLK